VLTAVHGLHLIGGLYVWGRTYARMRYQRVELIDVRLSIELCSVYFHYLLLVWIVLFGLLLAT
jgi:cytochrome c oxidase subunit 3